MAKQLDRIIPFLALLALTPLVAACDESEEAVSEELAPAVEDFPESVIAALPEGATVETLREGREQYSVCLTCHGADAEGTQLGPPLRGAQWIHSDGSVEGIARVIQNGVLEPRDFPVPMPPMGGGDFDEEELRAVSTYVYALGIGG